MRVYNFSAGPSALPLPVLEKAQKELCEYQAGGMSVMEMSHRSKMYMEIIEKCEKDLRKLMNISDAYKILFLQGGASLQFSMIPLNLLVNSKKADYINTGEWSKKAIQEGSKLGKINIVASSEESNFDRIPEVDESIFDHEADYLHFTYNNTIYGTKFHHIPNAGSVPLVTDMSSAILSEVVDVNRFGLIYAGAQKNVGPAGLTIVIIREDLIGKTNQPLPAMLDYKIHSNNGSMYNTPPTFAIYMAGLVFSWLEELGGISVMQTINKEKAQMLYDFLDASALFKGTALAKDRSLMNVPFALPNEDLNAKFLKEAEKNGLVNLQGHRSVGGMRASIYNATPKEGVAKLVDFMKKFEVDNRHV